MKLLIAYAICGCLTAMIAIFEKYRKGEFDPRNADDDDTLLYYEPIAEAWWLACQMDNYCVGYNEVEYNGKWYYTVHHA